MFRINQIKISAEIPVDDHSNILTEKICKLLNIDFGRIVSYDIVKRSIDARKKEVNYVYCIDVRVRNEKALHIKNKDIMHIDPEKGYFFPYTLKSDIPDEKRPVVIGLGPAGLFCAYMLAKAGFRPIVLERGKRIEDRQKDVERFWETGILDTGSNVQFGEGGAGAFSDGKLNTVVKDKNGRNKQVLKIFVEHGADKDILYDNKPHIGTDRLTKIVSSIRNSITAMGGEIHYECKADGFDISPLGIRGVSAGKMSFNTEHVALAVGHSARDTFELLKDLNIPMQPKAFAVGFRVMHPQSVIDSNQYGEDYDRLDVPVASYKLTHTCECERGVYSFCMCPGGHVVNASSEEGRLAVNGMSYHARDSKTANSAIVVQVTEADFEGDDVLRGMHFQRKLEKNAYDLANGKIPVQRYGDFAKSVVSNTATKKELPEFEPVCKGDYEYCELNGIMPQVLNECFVEGMEAFGRKIRHFNDANVIMAGIESRTSSPVRIIRDEEGSSKVKGLYPCGEGAGYAGGITSAAMDGIYIAEMIAADIIKDM
ncbi:MAG: FAD-dependent oxidoreductase [Lachnospiraceae bacterium]|nr:FAD-dependent oxidoreductase [Lachnospiraceae bacterium]